MWPLSLLRRGRVAVQRTAGWGISQSFIDGQENTIEIAVDLIVPETKNIEAFVREVAIPSRIAVRMGIEIVLTTVDLDD